MTKSPFINQKLKSTCENIEDEDYIDTSHFEEHDERFKSNLSNQIYFLKAPHLFIPKIDRATNFSCRGHTSMGHRRGDSLPLQPNMLINSMQMREKYNKSSTNTQHISRSNSNNAHKYTAKSRKLNNISNEKEYNPFILSAQINEREDKSVGVSARKTEKGIECIIPNEYELKESKS